MEKCIFCKNNLTENRLSDEHVLPHAIGGCLVIKSVCKQCNDSLGHDCDVLLTESPLIRMIRLGLRIPNKNGEIVSPLKDGRLAGHDGTIATYIQPTQNGKGSVSLRPQVTRVPLPDGGMRTIVKTDDARQSQEILGKMRARHLRTGGKGLEVTDQWSTIIKAPVVIKDFKANILDVIRPILKISYEMAFYWLGDEFENDPSAEPIRIGVTQNVLGDVDAEVHYFANASQFGASPIPSYCHVIGLSVVGNRGWVCLRLFNVIESCVLVSENMHRYQSENGKFIIVDPIARRLMKDSMGSFDSDKADILWKKTEQGKNAFRVSVHYEGIETTITTVSLEH